MTLSKAHRRIIGLSAIYLSVVLVSIIFLWAGLLDSWQEKLTDRFFIKSEPKQNIVILEIDSESINKVGSWPWPREVFATALSKIHGAKVIGIDVSFSDPSQFGTKDDEKLVNALAQVSKGTPIVMPVELLPREKVSDTPLSLFKPFVKEGFVNINPDNDSIARVASTYTYGFDSFAKQLASVAIDSPVPQSFRIDYKGPSKTFLSLPIIDLLSDKLPDDMFDNSIVLIGATANDLHDTLNTPFGIMPGVEVHANAIETLLDRTFRTPLSKGKSIAILSVVDLLALLYIVRIRRFLILIPSLLLLAIGFSALGLVLFSYNIIFPSVYVTLSFLTISFISLVYEFISESQEKKFIRSTFEYYLTPHIINELIADPLKLKLGGEKKRITVLFSDIAGFTSISEKLSPEDLTSFMNEYLSAMTDIILDHGGLVDKYIGDAIMAFWGAPLSDEEQETNAVRASIEMSQKLKILNRAWQKKGLPPIRARIGINTGEAVVGNMGSGKRLSYTAMGDEVNFASRLEGINNYYGTEIMISEQTKEKLPNDIYTREIDTIRVKGKSEPKKIFEVLSYRPDADREKVLQSFKTAKGYYTKGDFETAERLFVDTLALGDDLPTKFFLERVKELKRISHPKWDGVFDFHSK